jgi:hypothetical protein
MPGAWTTLEEDLARHPPAYILDGEADPKTAEYPVKDFPILARFLKERYQPVARTDEGTIYRRNDYRALAHHSPKSNR